MTDPRRSLFRHALALVVAFVAVTLTLPAVPAAQADRQVPFGVGETLTFDISWTSFVSAGTATLSVKERRAAGAGRGTYYLVAEAKPSSVIGKLYSLYYKAESMLDTRTLLPSLATLYSDEGGRRRYKTTTFTGSGSAVYEVKTATTVKTSLKVPAAVQDPLGVIYIIRALPLKAGLSLPIPVTDSGKTYTLRIRVGERESVKSGVGTLQAWKIVMSVSDAAGKATDTDSLTLWVSDDARKLPVKFQANLTVGSVQLTLAKVSG
jgi:hypothetical protein